jgi:hypothetical protein
MLEICTGVLKKVKIAVLRFLCAKKGKVDSAILSGEGKEVTGMTIFHYSIQLITSLDML